MKTVFSKAARAFTLVELLIASAVAALAVAAVLAGAIAMQRSFVAAEDFAVAKTDQARLSDYITLDLRRALSVTVGNGDGNPIVTMQIPDYYDPDGLPRTPTISNYVADYGDPAQPVTVVYRKVGSSIYRQENAETPREIAANVEDFQIPKPIDLGKVVKTQVTFAPRFERTATAAARTATTVYSTTMLRNKRKAP